ncbi:MAG TPA: 4Fe-4S binding protein [Elusimicrobiales bacterium]|nr:4Fe-4S binding protein [Elusimicrobiales bacterium]
MAHIIDSEKCTNCGACEPVCPVQSISEQEEKRIINKDTCVDCGACISTCPVEAISAS